MNIDLSGKTALVTGSTAGIGHAIAKGLAASGASVVINGRGQDKVDAAVRKLEGTGAKVRGIAADVSTAAGCKALLAALPEVDILINNAGIFEPKDFFEIPDEDWTRFFEVNVMSGVRLSRAYMQGMLERNWGRIVFISSESGLNIPVEMIHYGMSKTAQLSVARGLAQLTRGTGVTVNSVLPGPTMSEGVETFVKDLARPPISSSSIARVRCCNASPASTRSPTWWSMSPRSRRPRPTVRRCARKAASSIRSPEEALQRWLLFVEGVVPVWLVCRSVGSVRRVVG